MFKKIIISGIFFTWSPPMKTLFAMVPPPNGSDKLQLVFGNDLDDHLPTSVEAVLGQTRGQTSNVTVRKSKNVRWGAIWQIGRLGDCLDDFPR
jgi:hypothetical protein